MRCRETQTCQSLVVNCYITSSMLGATTTSFAFPFSTAFAVSLEQPSRQWFILCDDTPSGTSHACEQFCAQLCVRQWPETRHSCH